MHTIASKKIIIAPLNWGWGHATRCIPIITEIQNLGFLPVIATDGIALQLLQKEFPNAEFLTLPTYNIRYKKNFWWGMLLCLPAILKGVYLEHQCIKKYVSKQTTEVLGIITDNRLGVYLKNYPSVYITHQLNIPAGWFSYFVNKVHHYFIKKHQECWVPDEENSKLSGKLSAVAFPNKKYIGITSRLQKKEIAKQYKLVILLSGIEEQRFLFEKKVARELQCFKENVLLVRGTFTTTTQKYPKNITVVNYMLASDLEKAIHRADVLIARSGYSTVMDAMVMGKKTMYVPTPGQTEQEYLATYLANKGWALTCTQEKFSLELLKDIDKVCLPTMVSNKQGIQKLLQTTFNLSPK